MKITQYDNPALFEDCSTHWAELLADSDADQVFLTCEWQATWWEAYQPGRLLILVVQDEQTGQWQGIAPWFVREDEDGRRVVRTVGCVDVTDYLDVIARRGCEEAVYAALVDWLVARRGEYDEVMICNIPEDSVTLQRLPLLAEAQGLHVATQVLDVCPVIVLPEDFNAYLAGLDKKNRHETRRKLRKAAGIAEWYVVGPEHDLEAELQKFLTLMAASAPEKATFLDDARNRAFFELMVPKMAARGWLQLAFMTVAGEPAAAYLNFVYHNRVLVYNSGLNPADHGHLSPGIVLLARLIEYAITEGRSEFDFLRGNEPYKYDMGGQDTQVMQLRIQHDAGEAAGDVH